MNDIKKDSTTNRCINELQIAGLFDKDSDYEGMVGKAVQELLEVFGKQGHSGMSAPHVAGIFNRLVQGKTLSPLKGTDDEWVDIAESMGGDIRYQNNRCSAVFKKKKDDDPYYLNAIVWSGEETHDTFTGQVEDVTSRQYFKFPFTPKTFYIDVVEENGEHKIKDRKQLDEVFEYYLKK